MNLEKIKQLFSTIDIPNEFGGDYENEDYDWMFEWMEENILSQLQEFYTLYHGVSKIVMVPKNGDFVIKIPFNGSYSPIYNDEDPDEIIDHIWHEYIGAPEDCGWDYCATELNVYEKAKELGIECFFAKTEYLCSTKNFYPIYIQEKVKTKYNVNSKEVTPSNDSLARYRQNYIKYHNYGICKDKNWMALCLDQYGEEKVTIFIDFINNIMPFINCDMHSENYGFRINKTPCLIDFSDWCEND